MTVKFTNNASTTIGTGINASATSLTVASASSFPSLSGADDYCYLTLQGATNTTREVVKATALSSNTFTIVRAQDNTSAASWLAGDIVELRMTAALLTDVIDAATVEGVKTNYQYTPTSGQTVFSGADNASATMIINQAALVSVYMNGVRLVQGTDYSVSSANNTVTLGIGATTADIIDIEVYGNFVGQSGAAVGITGGSITGTAITATSLGATGTATLNTLVSNNATISGGSLDGVTIGGTTRSDISGNAISGTSFASTGNMTFGDNDKAIFGAGSDLQIYHTGSNSYIKDAGAGALIQLTNSWNLNNAADTQNMITATEGGDARLFYSGAGKLATTASGISVTGSVTADGLAVDGDGLLYSASNVEMRGDANVRISLGTAGTSGANNNSNWIYGNGTNLRFNNAGGYYSWETLGTERMRIESDGNVRINESLDNITGTLTLNGRNTGNIIFQSGGAEKMRIASSGFVGIGTSSPASALELSGAATANARLTLSQTTAGLSSQIQQGSTGLAISAVGSQPILLDTNGVEAMTIDASGSVGIGTSSPTQLLNLESATSPAILITDTTNTTSLLLRSQNNTSTVGTSSNHPLVFETNATEVMRLDASGNVNLYGTDNRPLAITSFATASAGAGWDLDATSSNGEVTVSTGGTEAMRIDSSQNLLVGTTVAGNQGVTIYGNGANGLYSKTTSTSAYWITNNGLTSATGTLFAFYNNTTPTGSITITSTNVTNYNSVSDERLKENIEDSDDSGTKIDSIQVRKFDWKTGGEHQDYGFIAQELVGVAPDAVTTPEDPEEMMSVDPAKLVPMMLKEIQSLRARVATLEGNPPQETTTTERVII